MSFARTASGIALKGNAANWWNAAAGIYERGRRPEPGSVLNFRSTGQMRLGHVAVVTALIDSRHIEVDHANWGSRGAVSRGVQVVDVSNANDWSSVRVGLPHSSDFGSTYPTYGFIYDRAASGTMIASGPSSGPASAVLSVDELNEASARHVGTLSTDPNLILDRPSRALR